MRRATRALIVARCAMEPFEEKAVEIIGVIGWILVGLGGIFTTWLFVRGFSGGMKEPMIIWF